MEKNIDFLKNISVQEISSGDGVGSTFILVFENDSYSLSVYCSWRLSKKEQIITSSLDSNLDTIPNGLDNLINTKVIDIFLKSFNDIQILFENDFLLDIFCDITSFTEDYFDTNWYVLDKSQKYCYSALPGGGFDISNF